MRKTLAIVTLLAWALWFGGMIVLIVFVVRLFQTSRDVGIQTAPVLFRTFALYQLILGTVACIGGTTLTLIGRRNVHAVLTLLMSTALVVAQVIYVWTNQMEAIRQAGQSTGEEFQRLPHLSSMAYAITAVLLFIAGIGWI